MPQCEGAGPPRQRVNDNRVKEGHRFWPGFPSGLRVLLVDPIDEDRKEIDALLEGCQYKVTALSSIQAADNMLKEKSGEFDIGLINIDDLESGIRLVQTYRAAVPLITTLTSYKTGIMYSAISAGSVDVLSKPISVQKLRNIYQHLVRQPAGATPPFPEFGVGVGNAGKVAPRGGLAGPRPKEEGKVSVKPTSIAEMHANDNGYGVIEMDKFVCEALGTLEGQQQVHRGGGTLKTPTFAERGMKAVSSMKKDTKPTMQYPNVKPSPPSAPPPRGNHQVPMGSHSVKELPPSRPQGGVSVKNQMTKLESSLTDKRKKVDWTPELHRRFVKAVEQLGIDNAIPSRILELMGVDLLTRHHIASHLQKYRKHRRNLVSRGQEINSSVAAQWPPGRVNRTPSDGKGGGSGGGGAGVHCKDAETTLRGVKSDYNSSDMQKGKKNVKAAGFRQGTESGKRNDSRRVAANGQDSGKSGGRNALNGRAKEQGINYGGIPMTSVSVHTGLHVVGQPVSQPGGQFSYGQPGPVSSVPVPMMGQMHNGGNWRLPLAKNNNCMNPNGVFGGYDDLNFDMQDFGTGSNPDSLEATIKDVLNSPDSDMLPLGLKPPPLERILEEAEQKGFQLDIHQSIDHLIVDPSSPGGGSGYLE